MEDQVRLELNDKGRGAFTISENGEQLGLMEVGVSGNQLTVYHTEVVPEAEGKGLAKKMLDSMVDHARKNHLLVNPLCQYVHAQFRRHPEQYADVWNQAK
jgi:predicted GNAT family acetyltransferase